MDVANSLKLQLETARERLVLDPDNPALKKIVASLDELIQLQAVVAPPKRPSKTPSNHNPNPNPNPNPAPPDLGAKAAEDDGPVVVWSKGQHIYARYKSKFHPGVIEEVKVAPGVPGGLEYVVLFDYGSRYTLPPNDITDQKPEPDRPSRPQQQYHTGGKKRPHQHHSSAFVPRDKPFVPATVASIAKPPATSVPVPTKSTPAADVPVNVPAPKAAASEPEQKKRKKQKNEQVCVDVFFNLCRKKSWKDFQGKGMPKMKTRKK
ncbi:MAG: hypothetical protein SGCHY_004990 [Lobulomycetales sp.]